MLASVIAYTQQKLLQLAFIIQYMISTVNKSENFQRNEFLTWCLHVCHRIHVDTFASQILLLFHHGCLTVCHFAKQFLDVFPSQELTTWCRSSANNAVKMLLLSWLVRCFSMHFAPAFPFFDLALKHELQLPSRYHESLYVLNSSLACLKPCWQGMRSESSSFVIIVMGWKAQKQKSTINHITWYRLKSAQKLTWNHCPHCSLD